MQQLQEKMEMARPKLSKMADSRAMELLAQHPQTLGPRVGPASEVAEEVRGGMSARLARVAGKKGGTNGRMESRMFGAGKNDRAVVEELMAAHERDDGKLEGGFLGALLGAIAPAVLGKIFGEGMCGGSLMEPAVMKKARTKKAMTGGAGMYAETAQRENAPAAARVPASGATIPRGAVAPISESGEPEAPASFERNTVGMGRAMLGRPGHGTYKGGMKGGMDSPPRLVEKSGPNIPGDVTPPRRPKAVRPPAPKTPPSQMQRMPDSFIPPKNPRKQGKPAPKPAPPMEGGGRSARGQKIAALMKSKGMSLGEASKYLKQHPDA